jgi:hypothetical protein
LLLSALSCPIMTTAAAAMSPTMLPFATRLLGRLAFGLLVTFNRDPIALAPGTIGGRIALRADQDPPRPASGCPGGLALGAGIAFRSGSFHGRLTPGGHHVGHHVPMVVVGAGWRIRNGFFSGFFVGRVALVKTGQCASLYYLQAA